MKTMRSFICRSLLLTGICVSVSSPLFPQAQPLMPPSAAQIASQPFQISFFVPIDPGSVNQLIQIVNSQVNSGRKQFIILLSSQGGEVLSGLAAYNYLHGLNVDLTTYNLGQVDSAANLIFCAGKHRYALPDTRFLVHSAFNIVPPGTPLNGAYLDGQLQQVRNMNRLSLEVIEGAIGKPSKEIEDAIQGQNIFDPQEALKIGLIQEIRPNFFTPGAAIAEIPAAQPTSTPGDTTLSLSDAPSPKN